MVRLSPSEAPERPFIPLSSITTLAFRDASSRRTVGLLYHDPTDGPTLGTGTLLRRDAELFVVTCGHVARDFFAAQGMPKIFTRDPRRDLVRDDVELVHYSMDAPDLALLAIARKRHGVLDGCRPITLADIDPEFDFVAATTPPLRTDFALCGFPAELAKFAEGDRPQVQSLSYTASPAQHASSSRSCLALDYPRHAVQCELPDAPGLSGALVWTIDLPRDGELWAMGRAVAVQHAWNKDGRFLRCDPLTLLHRWLVSR